MCVQKIVLESIKKRKGHGMTKAQIELAEAQATDAERFDKKISDLKSLVTEHIAKTNAILEKIDPLIEEAYQMGFIKSVIKSWKFWVICLLMICAIAIAGDKLVDRIIVPNASTIMQTQTYNT